MIQGKKICIAHIRGTAVKVMPKINNALILPPPPPEMN
jgi:hypothetical protein